MRASVVLLLSAALAWFLGCAPAQQTQELQFELQKCSADADKLRQDLAAERAALAALEESVLDQRKEWELTRAEANTLRARVAGLEQRNDRLVQLVEQRTQALLERPAVGESPLPPEIDQALEDFAARPNNRAWYDRDRAAISFANDQLFDPGSDVVRPDALPAMKSLVNILAQTDSDRFEIIVVGHTDDTPITKPDTLSKHPSNWHLSVHRAIAVKDVLMQQGLPARRLGVMGYGPYRPISTDRARNRRVEIFVVPRGAVQSFSPVRPNSP